MYFLGWTLDNPINIGSLDVQVVHPLFRVDQLCVIPHLLLILYLDIFFIETYQIVGIYIKEEKWIKKKLQNKF